MNINARQIKAIHALRGKLDLSDKEYRELLKKPSSKDLSFEEAKEIISAMVRAAGQTVPQIHIDRPGYASKKQINMLLAMWHDVSVAPLKERRTAFDKFLRNRFGIGCLNWLPKDMVGKIKCTLEAMKGKGKCQQQ